MTFLSDQSLLQRLHTTGVAVFSRLDELAWLSLPHRLETMLIAVCVNGSISATIDLKQRSMQDNSIMVLRPGHTLKDIVTSADFEGFFFIAGIDKLATLLPIMARMIPCALYYAANPIIKITPAETANLKSLYSMIEEKMMAEPTTYHEQIISALVELVFYEVLDIYTSHMQAPINKPSRSQQLLAQFMKLVEDNFRTNRTVLYYARELCVSPKHLSTVVRELSGRTAGEWIDDTVVLEAKMMLRNSSMSIQEISNSLSFPNQSFFGKYFKHHTGLSPREFRANPALV